MNSFIHAATLCLHSNNVSEGFWWCSTSLSLKKEDSQEDFASWLGIQMSSKVGGGGVGDKRRKDRRFGELLDLLPPCEYQENYSQ